MRLREAWDDEAERWIAWARKPGHDSYWHFHRRQLLGIMPSPGRLTLDLGCGEGRVGRDLQSLGHTVVSFDIGPAMVAATASHDQAGVVAQADIAHLPVTDGAADLAVAFMSFHDVDDLVGAIDEAWRALGPGGRLVIAIVHPLNAAGAFEDQRRGARFILDRPYLEERQTDEAIERNGLAIRFVSAHRPLAVYHRLLERAGFVVETVREPSDPKPESRWYDVPLFLHLVAVRPPLAARLDRRIFHIAHQGDVDELEMAGSLEPPSLVSEGFVHCSTAAQVLDTTARYYPADAELVLIELDQEVVGADVRWPEVYPGQRFPHLHGPLLADSVVAVHPWGSADRANWDLTALG